jgi:hypothetical protein
MPRTVRPHLMFPGVLAVVALLVLIAVPAALGAKPTRTVVGSEPFVVPAGFGCSFDLGIDPDEKSGQAITEFSDGRIQIIGHGTATVTNLETGDSFVQRSRYREIDTYDPVANDLLIEITGRYLLGLFPGDQGPFGEVGENGGAFRVIGHQTFTVDLDSDELVTSYSLNGQATDICPLISD